MFPLKENKEKKRGNPGTHGKIVQRILELSEEFPEANYREIHSRLKSWLERRADNDGYITLDGKRQLLSWWLPVDRTVANIIKRHPKPLPGEEDGSWSLAASAIPHFHVPPEANADLLEIWKWCVIVGLEFTIREAQWVVRLRGIVDKELLLTHAIMYAARERLAKRLGKAKGETSEKVDTYDLDAELAFLNSKETTAFLYNTAIRANIIPQYWPYELEEREGKAILSRMDMRATGVVLTFLGISEGFGFGSVDADRIYALCLRKLSYGPKWPKLSREEKDAVAKKLYEELCVKLKELQDKSLPPLANGKVRNTFKPSRELIEKVGLKDITEETKEGEVSCEATSSSGAGIATPSFFLWGMTR